MPSTAFHQLTIGPFHAEAELSTDGPYIRITNLATNDYGEVNIGPGSIEYLTDGKRNGRIAAGYWLVKYGNQERMLLEGATGHQIARITEEFGLKQDFGRSFKKSNAWLGLVSWAADHPKLALRYEHADEYIKGWFRAAKTEAIKRGIAQFEPPPRSTNQQRNKRRQSAIAAITKSIIPYDIPSMDHAATIVDQLKDILENEMFVEPEMATLHRMTAVILMRPTWQDVCASIGQTTPHSRSDADLTPEEFQVRADLQVSGLETEFGFDRNWAAQILARLHPTGSSARDSSDYLGHTIPSSLRSGLTAHNDDQTIASEFSHHIHRFENAARAILRLLPTSEIFYQPTASGNIAELIAQNDARAKNAPSLAWPFTPTASAIREAEQQEHLAMQAVNGMWRLFAALGPAPFLMPICGFGLTMKRWRNYKTHGALISTHGPIEDRAWLDVRYRHRQTPSPYFDWPADRGIHLILDLRRNLLDSGWCAGDVWLVSYQEGTANTHTRPVLARSGAEAVTWAWAGQAAFNELSTHSHRPTIRIRAIDGPHGPADVDACVADAQSHPIAQSPWFGANQIRAAARKAANTSIEWEVISGRNKRAVIIRDNSAYGPNSSITIVHDDLNHLMEALHAPTVKTTRRGYPMPVKAAPMEMLRAAAYRALDGYDPWAPGDICARDEHPDIADRKVGWNTLSRALI